MTTKQKEVVDKLVAARTDVTFAITEVGTKVMLDGGSSWPWISVGKEGGVAVGLRSYPENGKDKTAFTAAVAGDQLLAKQTERDAKRVRVVEAASEKPVIKKAKRTKKVEVAEASLAGALEAAEQAAI